METLCRVLWRSYKEHGENLTEVYLLVLNHLQHTNGVGQPIPDAVFIVMSRPKTKFCNCMLVHHVINLLKSIG